jgi:plasmid maintenance system antidote protein VapI
VKKLKNIHPGEILLEEFAKFWLGLQSDFDLEEESQSKEKEIAGIKHYTNPSH